MSQKELANRLGVTTATIRNWKKQGQIPKQAQQQKLNRVYGANKRYITNDTITQAERKIREYNVKSVFEVRHQKAAKQAKLICFSSDQVYSAAKEPGPYTEDMVAPGNLYARHKLEMEQRVLDMDPDAVMLRSEWMYGHYLKKSMV